MSSKAARREYLQAVADFDRGCLAFAQGMGAILDRPAERPQTLLSTLGPRKPAKRARPRGAAPVQDRVQAH